MARNTSITLGDHFGDFIDERVAAGRYGSAFAVGFVESDGVTETELMPRLAEGYTELGCGKLKKGNGFLKPNFGVWPNSGVPAPCLASWNKSSTVLSQRNVGVFLMS